MQTREESSESVEGSSPVVVPSLAEVKTATAASAKKATLRLALLVVATLIIWSSAFPAIKASLKEFPPNHVALLRFIVTSVILAILCFWEKIRIPNRAELPLIILGGLTGVAGYQAALSYGQQTVTAGAASFLTNTVPIFTALLAGFFLKEKLRWSLFAGMALSLAGALLIATGEKKSFGINLGAGAVLLAALSQAAYFIIQKKLLKTYSVFEIVCYSAWTGTAAFLVATDNVWENLVLSSTSSKVILLYLGIFPGVISFLAWSKVISMMPASRASSFLFLVPLFASTISWFWLGEIPGATTFAGGALALAGVVMVNGLPGKA
ncbi:MAG: DMT family transporter [Verrucomicrobiales bacterium]